MASRESESRPGKETTETHRIWTDERGLVHHQLLVAADPEVLRSLAESFQLREGSIIPSHKFLEEEKGE